MRVSLKLLIFLKKDYLQIFTAILALGLLFFETASAAPGIIGDITPSQNYTVTGTAGQTQVFAIPLNESTSVMWTENGTSTTLPAGEGNIATLNHIFQSGPYQVTASIDGAGQIAAWNVEGTGDKVSPEQTDYLHLNILSPMLNFAAVQETPELITVRITNNSGGPVQSSGFKYITANFSNGDPELQLFDDGTHLDAVAGDGVFSNQWTPASPGAGEFPAFCILRISADHESLGFAEMAVSGIISKKTVYPDLIIEDISWDPASPYRNDNITFRIIPANIGSGPSQDCTVKFYIGGGEVYSYSLARLEAGSNTSIKFNRVLTASGNMDIKAVVDTENKIPESDEKNNEKTESINVKSITSYSNSGTSTSGGGGDKFSSGSSSGGGAGGSPEPSNNIRTKELSQKYIHNGKHVKFTFPKNVTCITYLEFDSRRTAGKTTTIVEMLKNKSALIPELPSGKVYENVNIWVGNKGTADSKNIENAVLGFRVEKSWLASNGVDPDSIRLWRFSSGEWEELSIRQSGEDDGYSYFEAQTSGFTYFVITALSDETIENISKDSIVSLVKGSDVMCAILGGLKGKPDSGSLRISAMEINDSSYIQKASIISGEAGELITGRGVMRAFVVMALLSVTGYLGSLILRKQD